MTETELTKFDERVRREKAEVAIDEVLQAYYDGNRRFVPKYPWCFVRNLPREQKRGEIILPDIDMNKTQLEGVVLATWLPIERYKWRTVNGERELLSWTDKSELKPGDHVLYPHWAGMPVEGYSDRRYRIIREDRWSSANEGGIYAFVEHGEKANRPIEQLRTMLEDVMFDVSRDGVDYGAQWLDQITQKIEHKFLLIDREQAGVTLSGR